MSDRHEDIDEDEWDDEESVDPDDVEVEEDDDELDGPAEMRVADIEFDDSHEVVRQNRTIKMVMLVTAEIEVIEPPQVYDAEVHQQIKRKVRDALTSYHAGQLGTVTSFSVKTHRGNEEDGE